MTLLSACLLAAVLCLSADVAAATSDADSAMTCLLDDHARHANRRMVYFTNNHPHAVSVSGPNDEGNSFNIAPGQLVAFYAVPGQKYVVAGTSNEQGAESVDETITIPASRTTQFRLGAPYQPLNQSLAGFRPAHNSGVAVSFMLKTMRCVHPPAVATDDWLFPVTLCARPNSETTCHMLSIFTGADRRMVNCSIINISLLAAKQAYPVMGGMSSWWVCLLILTVGSAVHNPCTSLIKAANCSQGYQSDCKGRPGKLNEPDPERNHHVFRPSSVLHRG